MPRRATPSALQLWHVFASLPQLRHATDSPWSSSSFWMPNRAVVAAAVFCAAPSACHRLVRHLLGKRARSHCKIDEWSSSLVIALQNHQIEHWIAEYRVGMQKYGGWKRTHETPL